MRVIKRSNRPTARGCVLASQPTAPAHHPSRLTIRVGAPSESAHCPSAPFGPFDSQIYLLPGAAPRAQPRATRASESNTSTVENRPGLSRIPNLFAPGRREQIYLSNLLAKPRAESNTGDRRPPGPIAGIQHEVLARAPRPEAWVAQAPPEGPRRGGGERPARRALRAGSGGRPGQGARRRSARNAPSRPRGLGRHALRVLEDSEGTPCGSRKTRQARVPARTRKGAAPRNQALCYQGPAGSGFARTRRARRADAQRAGDPRRVPARVPQRVPARVPRTRGVFRTDSGGARGGPQARRAQAGPPASGAPRPRAARPAPASLPRCPRPCTGPSVRGRDETNRG